MMKRDVPATQLMKTRMGAALAAAALVCSAAAGAQNMTLQSVYEQMDKAAAKFKSVEANIAVDRYTAIVQEHSTQKGTTAFQRAGGSIEMAMHLDAGSDDPETIILYKNGELDLYQPEQKTETVLSTGANRSEADAMLTTGFGASSKDLTANWDVTFGGMETIDGVPCAKLDLVSKQQNVKNNFSHVTVWVDLTRDVSLQQIMYQPDGDSRTAKYTITGYNNRVAEKTFKLNLPSGVQVTRR
jgi:outer membrane lipoprotein-sorting protein